MLPKRGRIWVGESDDGSLLRYEVEVYGFAKWWLIVFAIVLCWLIFPPVIVYRALNYHPERLMRNLLQGV